MSRPSPHLPVKPFVGIITSATALIDEVRPILCEQLGEIDHESPLLDFDFTDYYEPEMGRSLKRKFLSFSRLISPEELPELKLWTNGLEARYAGEPPAWRPLADGRAGPHAAVCAVGQAPVPHDTADGIDATCTARPVTGRRINLDPGYVTQAKVVLATAKDFSHRIYLRDGIYAEVTLKYGKGTFHPWPWTFPDYRQESYISFFNAMRAALKSARDHA
ncbi:MAG: DUF4416 family protein [Planctomycetota bacterium]|nr:DUF4416 family protein [Planctomycetota bacterium]